MCGQGKKEYRDCKDRHLQRENKEAGRQPTWRDVGKCVERIDDWNEEQADGRCHPEYQAQEKSDVQIPGEQGRVDYRRKAEQRRVESKKTLKHKGCIIFWYDRRNALLERFYCEKLDQDNDEKNDENEGSEGFVVPNDRSRVHDNSHPKDDLCCKLFRS